MSGTPCQGTEIEDLVAAYRSDLIAADQFAEHPVTSVARAFLAGVGLDGWARLPLADQCALPAKSAPRRQLADCHRTAAPEC